jgi:endonuclease/exonuclease/phosphatase family metal-dependent hydrolase
MESGATVASFSRLRQHLFRWLRDLSVLGVLVTIVAGLVGQVIRDRSIALAVLMYLPLLPAGLAAIVLDSLLGGRAIPRARFGLALLGVVAGTWAVATMIGGGVDAVTAPPAGVPEISMLHWNVQWGGGLFRNPQTWASQRSEILRRDADIIVLSELPPADWLVRLTDELGADASTVYLEHNPGSRYEYRMAVCSRWPIRLEQRVSLPGGAGMSVTAKIKGRGLRILCVDGQSNPFRSRLPFLVAIADLCRAASNGGRPFDVVVGDFNTPARSLGFDSLMDQGYTLASRSTAGWRGTFPSWLPLYDIDHVWLGPGLGIRSCRLYNGPSTDHRGQFLRFTPAIGGEQAIDGLIKDQPTPGLSDPRQESTLSRYVLPAGRAGARRSGASASSRKSRGLAE